MTPNVEMIGPTGPVPEWVLTTDVEDIILDEILQSLRTNSWVMAHVSNGERHIEKISLVGILGDEMATEKSFFEVKFTGIVTFGIKIHRQQHVCKGIISSGKIKEQIFSSIVDRKRDRLLIVSGNLDDQIKQRIICGRLGEDGFVGGEELRLPLVFGLCRQRVFLVNASDGEGWGLLCRGSKSDPPSVPFGQVSFWCAASGFIKAGESCRVGNRGRGVWKCC
ncbi:hypothetical protein F3Y22_tig00112260pilonHSYRG00023 [Hibiscus syriacus]|uniref:Uncharacterized protein n=1 Tax=Hibiscus syriacus TaxID=106335 RepID=A0A6A2XQ82_HIBSY|nr:hypothetical protein F3Y22_tig00112260pilonHSYRG00023 [Hibiscus syriacus]